MIETLIRRHGSRKKQKHSTFHANIPPRLFLGTKTTKVTKHMVLSLAQLDTSAMSKHIL